MISEKHNSGKVAQGEYKEALDDILTTISIAYYLIVKFYASYRMYLKVTCIIFSLWNVGYGDSNYFLRSIRTKVEGQNKTRRINPLKKPIKRKTYKVPKVEGENKTMRTNPLKIIYYVVSIHYYGVNNVTPFYVYPSYDIIHAYSDFIAIEPSGSIFPRNKSISLLHYS